MVMGKGGVTTGNAEGLKAADAPAAKSANMLQNLGAAFKHSNQIAQGDLLRAQDLQVTQNTILTGLKSSHEAVKMAGSKIANKLASEGLKYSLEALRLKNKELLESI